MRMEEKQSWSNEIPSGCFSHETSNQNQSGLFSLLVSCLPVSRRRTDFPDGLQTRGSAGVPVRRWWAVRGAPFCLCLCCLVSLFASSGQAEEHVLFLSSDIGIKDV